MAFTVHVDIVSAEQEIFSGLAEMVFAPAIMGEVGIAPHHTPLITNLAPGEVRLKIPNQDEEQGFYVSGGILEVQPHVVTILSDTAMRAEDLDEAAVLKAKEQAEQQLHDREANMDYAKALAEHAAVAAQLQAIQRLRKRTGRS
jgi:F-type H+-transporting ATPase subunit epsilon